MAGAQINGHTPPPTSQWRIMGALRTLASALPGRARIAEALGKTFGGDRDLYGALGYKKELTAEDYELRYRRGGIAKRLVEAYPRATWGDGVQIYDDEDASVQTDFQLAIEDEFKRLDVLGRMMRLDVLAGLGRYGVMLVGVDQDLAQEATPGEVLYLQPLSELRARIVALDEETSSPRFGLPLTYRVKLGNPKSSTMNRSREITVHHSHVIHFCDGSLEDDIYGKPRLESCWNYLDDLDKLVGGGSEAAWRRAVNALIFNLDPDAEVDDPTQEAMKEQIVEFEHNLRRMLTLSGMDVKSVDGAPFSFRDNALMVVALLSATEAIPQRKLLGSERGELASTQDDKEMNDNVARRRSKVADPALRLLVGRMIDSGQLPKPKGGQYEIAWPEEEELSEDEKASLVLKFAQANAANKSPIVTVDEIRDRVLDLDPMPSVDDDTEEEEAEESDAEETSEGSDGEGGGGAVDGGSDDPASEPVARTAAAEPAWKKIHRVADAYEPRLRKAFDRAFAGARDLFPMSELEQAIEAGDHARAERLLSEAVAGFGELVDKNLPREVATIFTGDKT